MDFLRKESSDLSGIDLSILDGKLIGSETYSELADICANYQIQDYDWAYLAGRCYLKHLQEIVPYTFHEVTEMSRDFLDLKYYEFVMKNWSRLESFLVPERDRKFSFQAIHSMSSTYLLRKRMNNKSQIVELPQYMYLRVAIAVWYPNMERIRKMYDETSMGYYSCATPTNCNAGTRKAGLTSCVLMYVGDNMESITKNWKDSAILSASSAGLGGYFGDIRHSEIGVDGLSKGLVPWIRIDNTIIDCVDQRGKRKGFQGRISPYLAY